MAVHVVEAGQQHATCGIDLAGGREALERRVGARDGDDATALDVDIAQPVMEARVLGVEHLGVADDAEAGHRLREPRRHGAEQRGLGLLLQVREPCLLVLIALGQRREIARHHHTEEFRPVARRRPHELRRETEAGERDQFHLAPRRALPHGGAGERSALHAADRQRIERATAGGEPQHVLVDDARTVERQIELAERVIAAAPLGGGAPGAAASLALVALVDDRPEGGLALRFVARERAVRGDPITLRDLRAAAVVLEDVAGLAVAAIGAANDELAGGLAVVDRHDPTPCVGRLSRCRVDQAG